MKNVFSSFRNATFGKIEVGPIKNLKGFVKGRHTVPKQIDSHTEKWVKTWGNPDVQDLAGEIRLSLAKSGIQSKDDTSVQPEGSALIETTELDFNIDVNQSTEADEYVLQTWAKLKSPELFKEDYVRFILNEFTEDLVLGFTGPNIDVSETFCRLFKVSELENAIRYEDDRKSFRLSVDKFDVSFEVSQSSLKLSNIFSKPEYADVNKKLKNLDEALAFLTNKGVALPVSYVVCCG